MLTITKIIVSVILLVIGGIVTHKFTSRRDFDNKRRELITGYLIEAYKILSQDIMLREQNEEMSRKLEEIISYIQLFGNEEQIRLAYDITDQIEKGSMNATRLVNLLRDNLRDELKLPVSPMSIFLVRTNIRDSNTQIKH